MLSMWQASILRPYGDLGRYEDYKQSPASHHILAGPATRPAPADGDIIIIETYQ